MDIIIFAIISLVLLYKLYNVLGDEEYNHQHLQQREYVVVEAEDIKPETAREAITSQEPIHALDPNFSATEFISKAQMVYTIVWEAFANYDTEPLQHLLAAPLYEKFIDEITTHQKQNKIIKIEVISFRNTNIQSIDINEQVARITINWEVEQITNSAKKERVSSTWCFTKDFSNPATNWLVTSIS